VHLRSGEYAEPLDIALFVDAPGEVQPPWGRYVAGVVSTLRPPVGFRGEVATTLPVGAGLSSSAALEVAVALALGFPGSGLELALACQAAEQTATGVPCGVMDQLASVAGIDGHALLIDCALLEITPVPVPDSVDIVVVHSGEQRALASTAYAQRRTECERAESIVGPLRRATLEDVATLEDPVLRARARHVVSENQRVRAFATALAGGALPECGHLMVESHRSLARDFEVSTERLDALVRHLTEQPGVYGARLTGAGFGGCVVALSEPGALAEGWHVRASPGARRR
jgi:galactokinase